MKEGDQAGYFFTKSADFSIGTFSGAKLRAGFPLCRGYIPAW